MPLSVPNRVETTRLVLRRYREDDAPQLAALVQANVAHLERYMEWIAYEPQTVAQRREFIAAANAQFEAGTDFTMGMFLKDGTLIGGTGYHVLADPDRLEIGYWVSAAHEGQGFVTEAAAALTWAALTHGGSPVVEITSAASNDRSSAIPARLGYIKQDSPGHTCFDGGRKDPGVMWWATAATLKRGPLTHLTPPTLEGDSSPDRR